MKALATEAGLGYRSHRVRAGPLVRFSIDHTLFAIARAWPYD